MRRWTRPLPAEPDRAILSNVWTTSTCYKPREIERLGFGDPAALLLHLCLDKAYGGSAVIQGTDLQEGPEHLPPVLSYSSGCGPHAILLALILPRMWYGSPQVSRTGAQDTPRPWRGI